MIQEIFNKMRGKIPEKKTIILSAALIALMIGLAFAFMKKGRASDDVPESPNLMIDTDATDKEEEAVTALKNRNVFFAGMDNITADKDTVVRLENLKDNGDILISYSIIDNDTGRILFSTDLIPAGQHVDWKPSESLEAGSYDICYVQNPVWQDEEGNFVPLTSADNMATLTLKKEGGADERNKRT